MYERLSVCRSVRPSVRPSVCLSVYAHLFLYLYMYMYVCTLTNKRLNNLFKSLQDQLPEPQKTLLKTKTQLPQNPTKKRTLEPT